MTSRFPYLIAAILVAVTIAGCNRVGGPARAAVRGSITLDEAPLEHGSISFFPSGATSGPVTGAHIIDGQYAIAAARGPVVGQTRVEIVSTKPTGRRLPDARNPGSVINETISLVPARYNRDSVLTVEIQPGSNVFDFHLKSK